MRCPRIMALACAKIEVEGAGAFRDARIRVRNADWLCSHSDAVSSGLPSIACILASHDAKWLVWMQGSATPPVSAPTTGTAQGVAGQ